MSLFPKAFSAKTFSAKTMIRAGVVGLALSGSALVAAPAQAEPSVSFGFHFGSPGYHHPGHWTPRPVRDCLTDRQVRRLLNRNGYDDIRFTDRRGRVVQLRAEKGRHSYRVTVDACRGRIIDVDRLRRR